MSCMKIAFVLFDLGDGGTHRSALNLAKGFRDKGFEVDLLVTHGDGVYKNFIPEGVNLIDLHLANAKPKCMRKPLSFIPLVSYFRNNHPDIVYPIFDFFEAVVYWAMRYALRSNNRPFFIYSIRNDVYFFDELNFFKRKLVYLLKKIILCSADAVVAISHGLVDSWTSFFKLSNGRIDVIYNTIDIDNVKNMAYEECNHPWVLDKEYPLILSVGRLAPQKDHATLIKAFAQLLMKRKARLIILGEGPERPRLEAMIRNLNLTDYVDLPGFVQNPFPYLKNALLFVLSSRYEGFANVLAEALSLGIPVVSADCPHGPREILQNGQYGPLVPVGDSNELARAMLDTLESPLPSEILRRRAEEFSIDRAVNAYLDLFDRWKHKMKYEA